MSATEELTLQGRHVRLEPLGMHHVKGFLEASKADASLYALTFVPLDETGIAGYIETALKWKKDGSAVPFAIVRLGDGAVIGSTRFFEIERWPWPSEALRDGRAYDACEIGYTWLTRSAIRTAANTEAKLLMLTHAFEVWRVLRVCFHTDERNTRSRDAIERIGGQFEGILRAYRIATDLTPRNSARYSIVAAEWPEVKRRLEERLQDEV